MSDDERESPPNQTAKAEADNTPNVGRISSMTLVLLLLGMGVLFALVMSGALPSIMGNRSGQAHTLVIVNDTIYRGTPGQRGPSGPTGPTGAQGAIGPPGQKGDMGACLANPACGVGPKGDKGDVGPQGNQGGPGLTGGRGPPGGVGPAGPNGTMGPKGDKGENGTIGLTGETGMCGCGMGGDQNFSNFRVTMSQHMEANTTFTCGTNSSIDSSCFGASSCIDRSMCQTTELNLRLTGSAPTKSLQVMAGDIVLGCATCFTPYQIGDFSIWGKLTEIDGDSISIRSHDSTGKIEILSMGAGAPIDIVSAGALNLISSNGAAVSIEGPFISVMGTNGVTLDAGTTASLIEKGQIIQTCSDSILWSTSMCSASWLETSITGMHVDYATGITMGAASTIRVFKNLQLSMGAAIVSEDSGTVKIGPFLQVGQGLITGDLLSNILQLQTTTSTDTLDVHAQIVNNEAGGKPVIVADTDGLDVRGPIFNSAGSVLINDNVIINGTVTLMGDITISGACMATCVPSDKRIKNLISPMDTRTSLERIMSIPLYNYNYTDEYLAKYPNERHGPIRGVWAQDVATLVPQAVHTVPERAGLTDFHFLNKAELIPDILAAIQELTKRLDKLSK